ncbi:MAG: protein kinase [Deltaproteobacteria bacterium]|nr:protein kinase [Deltaproteobacteria bacterium]
MIHRDLKPGNIMVRDDGTVSILDFGMATADDLQRITRAGRTVGSLRFIAPEVWEGKAATTASDLYAVGVTLYACLAGRLPYDVQTPAAMFEALKKPPPPLTELGVHPAVDAVVRRAMVRDPKKRFATIEALLLAFAQAVRDAGGGPKNDHDEPTTSTGTVLVRDRSDAGKAVDPLMPRETLVSASPFVQAAPAARSSRLGLWITAALGVVIAAAVIAALVLEPSTVVAGTKREHLVTRPDTPDEEAAEDLVPEEAPAAEEPTLALEPLRPRPERAAIGGAERVRALMERRGLRQSDVPQLDRLVDLAQRMERANRPDEARQATDRALAMATAVPIDRSFVTAKQKRLVERAERAPPALKARLFDTLADVEKRAARADYAGANLAINRGLDLTP